MRYGTGFGVQAIFITHLHADHFLGITGLLRTMGLQGRQDPIALYGPRGSRPTLRQAVYLGVDRLPFEVSVEELEAGEPVACPEFDVVPFAVNHGTPALGYALREHFRLGRFDVDRARELGVPEGPLFGKLHRGESVEVDGRFVDPAEVVGPSRPGRIVLYSGDTRPSGSTVEAGRGADLLIHEATFGEEESDRAHETFHTTASGAAQVARDAGTTRLILTHISARYSEDPSALQEEARRIFPRTQVGHDGMTIELAYQKGPEGEDPMGSQGTAQASGGGSENG